MKKLIVIIRQNIDLTLILLLASVLRLTTIIKDELWYDEAFTGLMLRAPRGLLLQIMHEDPHPPLYTVINKVWSLVFGVNDLSLRILPFIFGIVTIVVVYKLVLKLFNKETALIASFLLAVSPFMVGYSIEARSYAFYALLMVLALYLILQDKFTAFVITLIALYYTHYASAVYFPILGLLYIYRIIKVKYPTKKILVHFILFAIPVAIIFNYGFLSSRVHQNDDWAGKASLVSIPKSIASYSYGVKTKLMGASQINDFSLPASKNLLIGSLFIIYTAGMVLALAKTLKQKNYKELSYAAILLSLIFIPQLMLIVAEAVLKESFYVERYLIPSGVFFLLSVAFVLRKLMRFEFLVFIVCAYCLLLSQIQPQVYYTGMRVLADKYSNYTGDIVFTSPVDYTVGLYYLDGKRVKLYDPKNPNETFTWWWFITDKARPDWNNNAVVLSPDANRMTDDFTELTSDIYGNYKVYVKIR